MRLLTVILHYGKTDLTRRVHEDLQLGATSSRQNTPENSLIVIDNAAPEPYPRALRLEKNVFWGGALAIALKMAEDGGFSHLWFCNNDIRLISAGPHIPKVCARLARVAKLLGREVGIYSPAAVSNPYHPHMQLQNNADFTLVPYVDGIAPVISLQCLKAIGGLDMGDNMRGYGLDVWLSLRAHRAGFAVVVDHQLALRHIYHTTAKSVPGFMDEAAMAENDFMGARLGKNWREVLNNLSANKEQK